MSQMSFSPDWIEQFTDPYAVLGLSVAADDRRVLKRYRTIAKLLHPDSYIESSPADRALAGQILARLVNPAYQNLKQEKGRTDVMATLRFRVRSMNRDEPLLPQTEPSQRLMRVSVQELDIFYEQAITQLAEAQFQPLQQFPAITQQLSELNLTYLHLKMGTPMILEKRTGIVSATKVRPQEYAPSPNETAQTAMSYAQRHYQRAREYGKNGNWAQAVAELRDAIRLEPNRGEYHALLAKAYLEQGLMGMAKVHFRQALKFNPREPLALYYANKLNLAPDSSSAAKEDDRSSKPGGFFGLFARKR